jgi:hypothetical protein
VKPLDVDTNLGFRMSTVCTLVTPDAASESSSSGSGSSVEVQLQPSSSLSNPYNETSLHSIHSYKDCYTSTFLVLRRRDVKDKVYEQIIMCVLLEYDRPASVDGSCTLAHCLEKDVLTGGAICLQVLINFHLPCHFSTLYSCTLLMLAYSCLSNQIVFTNCFSQHAPNQLAQELPSTITSSSSTSDSVSGSSLARFSLLTFNWQSDLASSWQLQQMDSDSLDSTLNCFVHRLSVFFKTLTNKFPDLAVSCPAAYDLDDATEDIILPDPQEVNYFDTSAVWLGRNLGFKWQNHTHKVNVPFTKWEREKKTLDWFVPEKKSLLHHLVELVETRMCRPIGGFDISNRGSCLPFASDSLTSRSSGAHGHMDTSVSSQLGVHDGSNTRVGKSCSINFVIPGFMKCASSFLFEGTFRLD